MELYIGRNGKNVKEWSKVRRCNNCHDSSGMFDNWNFCPICGVKALYEAPEKAEGYFKPIPYTVEKEGMIRGSKYRETNYKCGNCKERLLTKIEWEYCCHCGGGVNWVDQEVEEVQVWNWYTYEEKLEKEQEAERIRRKWRNRCGY